MLLRLCLYTQYFNTQGNQLLLFNIFILIYYCKLWWRINVFFIKYMLYIVGNIPNKYLPTTYSLLLDLLPLGVVINKSLFNYLYALHIHIHINLNTNERSI